MKQVSLYQINSLKQKMESLKEIVNVSGKGGLFKIVKPGRVGVIVESLDDKKEKTMIGPTARVSSLKDISMFMADGAESMTLGEILKNAFEKFEGKPVGIKTMSDYEVTDFMSAIAPNYDTDKVYLSDMRKLGNWYNILIAHAPELFTEKPVEATEEIVEAAAEITETAETEAK